ncbi:LytR C-terminal domain-containing protein [Massilia putida]|uniref:LytR C-terminal domain-containing protein n=1 Tax=Massilia putida TaxID=1141883 RepID=UPI0009524FFA|nr:LytR C-terminal domain-containing protein [Massilia putida]
MRARIRLYTVPLLCSGVLLLACSSPPPRLEAGPSAFPAADDSYLRGRNLYLARRYDEAIAAYEAALRIDGTHVNARNGLAIAYAERRDFTHAIPIWRELTRDATMASGPASSFLFANLGYAYLLSGDVDAAQVALEKACLLDPLSQRAWQYLGETLVKLGQEERGRQMLRQAEALREHDFRADYATANGGTRLPAIEEAVKTDQHPDAAEWASVEVTRRDDGMLELRRVPANVAVLRREPVGTAAVQPQEEEAVARLEISNGDGREGLARLLSRQLRDPGLKVVRLTNEKGFGVRQTRVEYQAAFRTAAERLARHVGSGEPVEVGMAGHADVRLVIGHDLPLQRIAARPPSGPLLAQAGRSGAP